MSEEIELIIENIREEISFQRTKWGVQNHPALDPALKNRSSQRMCDEYGIPSENIAKQSCDLAAEKGLCTWMHILVEEVSETASAKSIEELRKELIQVAAVAISAIESLDRNGQ